MALSENWAIGSDRTLHPTEHNVIARILNFRRYSHRYSDIQAAVNDILGGTPAQAINGMRRARQVLEIPPETEVDAPIQIYGAQNVTVRLLGRLTVTQSIDTLFDVCGAASFTLENGNIHTPDGVTVGTGVHVRNDEEVTPVTTKRARIRGVEFTQAGTGRVTTGIQLGTEGNTLMLDECHLEGIGINGLFGSTQYGIRILGSFGNNTQHTLTACFANHCDIGYSIEQVNVVSLRGCNADGGAPDSGGGSVAYYVNSLNCHISDCRAEAYQKLLASGGPSTAMAKMRLTNVDYAAQEMDSEDVNVIDWKYAGLLALDGVTIGEPAAEPRIKLSSSATCRLSGVVQVYGANNRPAAEDLVDGANVAGSLVYQQGDDGPALVSDEVINFDV